MRVFSNGVRKETNVLIPMRDGVELASDLWLPEGHGPFPAILSFYPYHKDDLVGAVLGETIEYFASHGYAGLLVDLRGTGNSGGVNNVPFARVEADDSCDIIEWAAKQPWCDGNVGMWGISYGAFTCFKAASERPEHLRAIIPIFGTTKMYHNCAYLGGTLSMYGSGIWGTHMVAMNLLPPTFKDTEGRWLEIWKKRLENLEPWMLWWLSHPVYDGGWEEKTVDPSKIKTPTLIFGGWHDIFPEMPTDFELIKGPKRLIMGPWVHDGLLEMATLEPIDQRPLMLAWMNRWVRGDEKGLKGTILDGSAVTIYVQGEDAGWRQEDDWPIPRMEWQTLYLTPEGLVGSAPTASTQKYEYDPTVGINGDLGDPVGLGFGWPRIQNPDDQCSLTYTSLPLNESLEITGSPEVILYASSSVDNINFVAKLCDVANDGTSRLLATGWLRGSHHKSHAEPEPMKPNLVYELRIPLWATSYRIGKGHRLRVSVACSDFPRVWPTHKRGSITVHLGRDHQSQVRLPTIPVKYLPKLEFPRPRHPSMASAIIKSEPHWDVTYDLIHDAVGIEIGKDTEIRLDDDKRMLDRVRWFGSVARHDPGSAYVRGNAQIDVQETNKHTIVVANVRIDPYRAEVEATIEEDGAIIFRRSWSQARTFRL